MRRQGHVWLAAVLLGGCFSDTQGDDGAEDSSSTGAVSTTVDTMGSSGGMSDGESSTMSGTSGPDETDTGSDNSGTETGSSTGSSTGEPSCEPGDCAQGDYCVDGGCQDQPPADMVEISSGSFYRGCNDSDCEPDESPPDPSLMLSTFAIDRLEVTAGAYELCVEAGACEAPGDAEPECNGRRLPTYADHPINCVTYHEATDYCAWAGKRLPTEAEWEKAARGIDGRRFPWGADTPSCTYAVIVTNGYGCGTGETWPVGSKPQGASPFGVLNMNGNVREWTADWYGTYEVGVDDPQGPATGTERVARGASLVNGATNSFRISNRTAQDPATTSFAVGFRCATSG